ncbi:unnamed protein product [Euphydryas editha]|uniref:HTH psq-type domain-containing protein n=1 Tax=Euphydryas editha TaxID=104508 RepID=A0AAU9UEZ0_EUPED|nr:unnamed protein product [Euphydryas editha]
MRVYRRKSERASQSQEVYELAAAEVLEKKRSIRKASQTFGLCHVSLYRYIKKKKNNESLRVGYVKPRQVFTAEEEGVTTVQKPKKIVAARGQKQIGAITSAERGTLVTLACASNAAGNFIPPMFVFPRLKYSEMFIRGGPPDCLGAALGESIKLAKSLIKFPQNALIMDKLAAVNSQLNPNSEESMRDEAIMQSLLGSAIEDLNNGIKKFQGGIGKHGKFYKLTDAPLKDWELEESIEEVVVKIDEDKNKKC